MNKSFVFDLECFPNLFTASFVNVDCVTEQYSFYVGLDKADIYDLIEFLKQEMILIGYNSISYDNPMLRYLMAYKGNTLNKDLFVLSGKLINDAYRNDRNIMSLRYPRNTVYSWKFIDLMAILAFDKLGISLKQTAINLKWKKIQDLPLPFDHVVGQHELDSVISYNINDVLITKELYDNIADIRNLRDKLTTLYGIDLTSASDSKMANLIFGHMYSTELHVDVKEIKDKRTIRDKVLLGDCIPKWVNFQTVELQNLLAQIKSTMVYNYSDYKFKANIFFAGCELVLGVGGLHTKDGPATFVSDSNYLIQDADVSSYYPATIINNNFYPEHLGPDFIKVLKKITRERIDAKKSGDKVKADSMKVTINSVFGKLGSDTFWLLDAKQMLSTTITGQMGLIMLVEDLHLNGIEVISCNTDGVVCRIDRSLLDKYYAVTKKWQEITNLELEYTPYVKYIRRDVNSYITVKDHGQVTPEFKCEQDIKDYTKYLRKEKLIKEKGAFLTEVDLKKAYHMPIVAKALFSYFVEGISVKKTIEDCKDIMDFCISQKAGSDFGIELHTKNGIEHLQKTNRFFISNAGGRLIKRDKLSGKTTGLYVKNLVTILNNYDDKTSFESYNVNLAFYEKEVMKIVDAIEPKQFSLFDMSSVEKGKLTKMDSRMAKEAEKKEIRLIPYELNKLGKNQLLSKIEDVVSKKQVIENINPRYVYVIGMENKSSVATLYCLGKATITNLAVDKKFVEDYPLVEGSMIYCTEFDKPKNNAGLSILKSFKVVSNFASDEKELMKK